MVEALTGSLGLLNAESRRKAGQLKSKDAGNNKGNRVTDLDGADLDSTSSS